jgi:hypothetical protein
MATDDDPDLTGTDQLQPDSNGLDEPELNEPEPDEPDQADEDDTDEPEPELSEPPSPPGQSGRRDHRISRLNERVLRAEERAREADRRLDEMLRQRAFPQQPQGETSTQREDRRSRMTPEERITEDLRDSEKRMQQQLQGHQFQTWDMQDRALYETKASVKPRYRRWQERVEKQVDDMKGRGQSGISRQDVYYWLLGKAMDEQDDKGGPQKQRTQAQRRVQANTVRPGSARSDAQASRRSGGKTLEERLSDVQI